MGDTEKNESPTTILVKIPKAMPCKICGGNAEFERANVGAKSMTAAYKCSECKEVSIYS